MLAGAREVPHGCGERGQELGAGVPHPDPRASTAPPALCTHALRGSVPHGRQSHPDKHRSAPRRGAEPQPLTNSVSPPSRHGARQRSTGCSGAGVGRGPQTPGDPQHSPHRAGHSRSCHSPSSSTQGSLPSTLPVTPPATRIPGTQPSHMAQIHQPWDPAPTAASAGTQASPWGQRELGGQWGDRGERGCRSSLAARRFLLRRGLHRDGLRLVLPLFLALGTVTALSGGGSAGSAPGPAAPHTGAQPPADVPAREGSLLGCCLCPPQLVLRHPQTCTTHRDPSCWPWHTSQQREPCSPTGPLLPPCPPHKDPEPAWSSTRPRSGLAPLQPLPTPQAPAGQPASQGGYCPGWTSGI